MGEAPARRRDYTEQEISDGLTALALYNGSASAAARELERQGRPIPKSTLQNWKDTYADRYVELQFEVRHRVWAKVADVWWQAAEKGGEATVDAIEEGRKAIEEGDSKRASEWGSAARNYATAGGISNDKGRVIDGEPTERAVNTNVDLAGLLRSIGKHLPSVRNSPVYKAHVEGVLDSTAQEIEEPSE